jgi:predicted transcriptional regulator
MHNKNKSLGIGIMSNENLQNFIKKLEATYGGIYPASKILNVDYSTLWRWKNGKQKPNTATLERIGKDMIRHDNQD